MYTYLHEELYNLSEFWYRRKYIYWAELNSLCNHSQQKTHFVNIAGQFKQMCMGNQTILRHSINKLTRTLKISSQFTRVQNVKITCQESKSIYPPKLVKHFSWQIDSDLNADQLLTRIIFLSVGPTSHKQKCHLEVI